MMTMTFDFAPRGYAVTYDFPAVPPPAKEQSPDAVSSADEGIDADWLIPPTPPLVGGARSAHPIVNDEGRDAAPLVAPGSHPTREREYPADHQVVPRASEALVGGGSGGSPHLPSATPTPNRKIIVACAMSGNLCAIATMERMGSTWRVCRAYTRLFQLTDTSQTGMRGFAGELFQFLGPLRGAPMISCPTKTGSVPGGLEDEARLETLLMMLPGLEVQQADNGVIANWVLSTNPVDPENMPTGRNTFAQIRAIEAAQYMARHLN